MMTTTISGKLIRVAALFVLIGIVIVVLQVAQSFLFPLVLAALIAMLFVPMSRWLERKKIPRALAALLCLSIFLLALAIVLAFISWQATGVADNANMIEQQFNQRYQQVRQWLANQVGISRQQQQDFLEQQNPATGGSLAGMAASVVGGIGTLLTNFLLFMVYSFLFLYYRTRIKNLFLRIVPNSQTDKTSLILQQSQKVTQHYLTGLSLMIVMLWILYSIGFSIVGVNHAIFFAVLCGVLEMVPFVGNLVGNLLVVLMVLAQGGGWQMVLGVVGTYALVQFIQTYLIQPLAVGHRVKINAMATIIGLVVGELIWGIAGMVVAIPILGIIKVVCDRIETLKPYGEFIGE